MAAVGPSAALSFRETLSRHLQAIQDRDLDALADTVADGALILITAEGKLVRDAREFLEAHRAWFAMDGWQLFVTPVEITEGADLGVAVLHLLYCESEVRQQSHLTLVFARRDGKWRMVLDQNTPLK
jgi:ketosteroid isomerase-like protein